MSLASDMFSQMRGVLQHQRLGAHLRRYAGDDDPGLLAARAVLEMACTHGLAHCGLPGVAGRISPGLQADLILLSTDQVNMIPVNDVVGAVVLGADTKNVDTVVAGGQLRKLGGRLVGVDVGALRTAVERSRDHVLARSDVALLGGGR